MLKAYHHKNLSLVLLLPLSSSSSFGIELDNQGSSVQFLGGLGVFLLTTTSKMALGAHPVSYPMGTRGSFPWDNADHSPPSSAEVKECMELYLHSHNTPSWRDARLKKHRVKFTLPYCHRHLQYMGFN
jgi:hypothetical protein